MTKIANRNFVTEHGAVHRGQLFDDSAAEVSRSPNAFDDYPGITGTPGGGSQPSQGFKFQINGITVVDNDWLRIKSTDWTTVEISQFGDLELLDGAAIDNGGDPGTPVSLIWTQIAGEAYIGLECWHDDGLTIGVDQGIFGLSAHAGGQPSVIQIMSGDEAAIAEDEDTIGMNQTLVLRESDTPDVRLALYSKDFDVGNTVTIFGVVVLRPSG